MPGMRGWLTGLGIAAAVMVASWVLLILLARRLPEGTAKELARFLPACVTTVRRLRAHPAVPRRAELAGRFPRPWGLSPSDLIPQVLPASGPLRDLVVLPPSLRSAAPPGPPPVPVGARAGGPPIL